MTMVLPSIVVRRGVSAVVCTGMNSPTGFSTLYVLSCTTTCGVGDAVVGTGFGVVTAGTVGVGAAGVVVVVQPATIARIDRILARKTISCLTFNHYLL
jgi:hypothetical protein